MPAKIWPPPIQRHKSGRARVRIAGKDYYLGQYGSEEAQQAYAQLLSSLARGEAAPGVAGATPNVAHAPEVVTVKLLVARWFAEEAPRYSAEGREATQFRLSVRPLLRLFGDLPAVQFNCDKLEQVQLAMASGSLPG